MNLKRKGEKVIEITDEINYIFVSYLVIKGRVGIYLRY